MKTTNENISLNIPKDMAVELADGMQIGQFALECFASEHPKNVLMQVCEQFGDDEEGVSKSDLEDYARALGRAVHLLGKELPKHFPELSRASRRGIVDDEDMGFI